MVAAVTVMACATRVSAPPVAGGGLPPPDPSPSPAPGPGPGLSPDSGGTASVPPPIAGLRLVWSDEFDGSGLDNSKWTAAAEPRRGARSTPDAAVVHDGMLQIRTYTEESCHYTAFLSTENKFSAKYGYFEARIRFNESAGEWCSFWLHSATNGNPVGDPGRAGVEIDVVEHKIIDESNNDLSNTVVMTLNWDGYGADHKFLQQWSHPPAGARRLFGEWHVYAVLWTEQGYTFYIDGLTLWNTTTAVSHRDEYVLLTCEVQDGSWAGWIPPGGYGSRNVSVTSVDVDWVRVWQY